MPVQIPDVSQNRRATPNPSGGVASYRGGIAEGAGQEIARSIGDAGQQMSNLGMRMIDVGGDIEYANARSKWLHAKIQADKAFDGDPDYKTFETRYEKLTGDARNDASSGISSASARRRFEVDADDDIARGRADLGKQAFAKETDAERARLNDLISANQSALLTTNDQPTINGLIGATNTAIQGAAAKGWVSAVEAGNLGRDFVQNSGLARLKMLPPQQRLAAIMSRASNAPQTPTGITEQPLMPTTVTGDIAKAARDVGVDPQTLQRIAELESSGNPAAVNPKNPDAVGLFQITAGTAAQYGLDDRTDPKASAQTAAELMKDNANVLRAKLGRDPTPAELYLAHQQGATGAAALLSHPDQSAVEALTPVYGSAAKAEKRILDNGGTSGMSAAAFTNMWSAKFGGIDTAVAASTTQPDGGWMFDKKTGTYLDFVPPDQLEAMRQDALRDIDQQETKVQRQNRIEVETGWDDAKTNALLTGETDETFIAKTAAAYVDDPAVATAKIAEMHSYALMGKDSAVIDGQSLDEGQAYVASLAPQAGSGSALQQIRYENAAKALAAKDAALKADPATWVRTKSPEVKDAWDQVVQALNDPQADPDDARMSAQLAMTTTVQEEERQGLTGSGIKVLPKDITTQAVDMLHNAKPTEIFATVAQMMSFYGTRGLQEIVQAGAPTDVFALASASGPEDGPWRSVLINAMQMKPEDLNKAVKARGIAQTEIDTAFAGSTYSDLIETLPPSAVPMYTKAISDVMDFQMSAGKTPEAALDFALQPFTNGFTFNGTYRVPLGFDADRVDTGLGGVIAHLEDFGIRPESSLSGNAVITGPQFSGDVGAAVEKFPALAKVAGNVVVEDHFDDPNSVGQLESYPPWESYNPHPGKFTSQIFNKTAKGEERTNLVAGDMLHYIGAVNPETGEAVDPKWRQMKAAVLSQLSPRAQQISMNSYKDSKVGHPEDTRTYSQWLDTSWGDEFIMGNLIHNLPEWQRMATPSQNKVLDQMKSYLSRDDAADTRVANQIDSLRQGHYRWITTEEGDGVVLTYDDGSLLGQPVMTDHGPLVVTFDQAQAMKFGAAPPIASKFGSGKTGTGAQ
jgi:hypothetical protein